MASPGRPNSYVRDLHAAVSTPAQVLAELVGRATGEVLDHCERIIEGYDNEVYRVSTVQGGDVVVRIRRFGGDLRAAQREAEAIEQARAVGVPGPEVLLLDTVSIDGDEFPVMVQRAVPGRPLNGAYNGLTVRQRIGVLYEIGHLIARLSRVPARADWSASTTTEVANRRAEREIVLAGGFSGSEFDRMINSLESSIEEFPCSRPVLCHGDLGPAHIYLDETARISGIIDFGDAHPGSPVHDLAVLRVRGPDLDLGPVLAGYGAPESPQFRRQLNLQTLLVALSSLGIGVDENDDACIARASGLIRSVLREI